MAERGALGRRQALGDHLARLKLSSSDGVGGCFPRLVLESASLTHRDAVRMAPSTRDSAPLTVSASTSSSRDDTKCTKYRDRVNHSFRYALEHSKRVAREVKNHEVASWKRAMKQIVTIAGLMLAPLTLAYAKIPPCKGRQSDATEVARSFRPCLTSNLYCQGVVNVGVYQNRHNRLPAAPKGETYWEARVGANRAGNAGRRRLVFLIQGQRGRATVVAEYFTADHYTTFCKMR